jgi:hypothetical protein
MQILDIKDDYKSPILLNTNLVHMITTFKIQVEKELVNKYKENTLHILYKKHPILLKTKNDDGSLCKPEDQKVDLPIELIDVLLLGIAVKAHGMGTLTNDPRTGTSYVQNPYVDRYELAIKKAIDNGYLNQTNINQRTVHTKGFF